MSIPIIVDSQRVNEQHFYIGYVKTPPNATSWKSDFPIRAKVISSGATKLLCDAIRNQVYTYSNFRNDVMAYAWTDEPGYPAIRGKLRYNLFQEIKGNSLFDLNVLYTALRLTHVFGPFGAETFNDGDSYSRYAGRYYNTPVTNDRGEFTYEGLSNIITSLPVITTNLEDLRYNRYQDSFMTLSLEDLNIRIHLHVIVYSPREIELIHGRNWIDSDSGRKSSYDLIMNRFNAMSFVMKLNLDRWYHITKQVNVDDLFYDDNSTFSSIHSGSNQFDQAFTSYSYLMYKNGARSDIYNGYKLDLGYNFHNKGFKIFMPLFAYDFSHPALLWTFLINWLDPRDLVRRDAATVGMQEWEMEHYE